MANTRGRQARASQPVAASTTESPKQAAKKRAAALEETYSDPKIRQYEELEASTDPSRHHTPTSTDARVTREAERMRQVYAERGRKS